LTWHIIAGAKRYFRPRGLRGRASPSPPRFRRLWVRIDPDCTFTRCVDFYRFDVWRQSAASASTSCGGSGSSVRQSPESTTTLICAFVSSRVDYCCSLLIGSPRSVTDKLQRVLSADVRVITNTKKYVKGPPPLH